MLETMGEPTIESNLKSFLLVLAVSLSVATLPQFFGWFRRIPYTMLLVIVGLGLAVVDVRLVSLSPELILSIFLPPLLFEAAWNLKWSELKKQWIPICLYAVFGVIVSISGIAIGLHYLASLSLTTALLIGASLSATDPVSVIALFRELGIDKRISTVMEGESLFNDGMAVVAFGFLVTLAMGTATPTVPSILTEFFVVVGVGVAVGTLVGFSVSYLTQRFDLPLVEQSWTLVSAYATYLIAEDLGGSGVIAVVIVGLILGNFGSRIGMNPQTRIIVTEFWEFLAFFVNSIVFLLIGDQIEFAILQESWKAIAVTLMSMMLARAISVYGLGRLSNSFTPTDISMREQTLLWWGGLRGSVAIALALSVPTVLPDQQEIIAVVFGVVLFTLLVQGLTIKPLLEALKLLGNQPLRQQFAEAIARLTALERVLEHLHQMEQRPGVDPEFCRHQESIVKGEIERLHQETETLQAEHSHLKEFSKEQLHQELLDVEAETYAELVQSGKLDRDLDPLLQQSMNEMERE